MIRVKRVYEPPAKEDGWRVLVDRLWPRGLTKEKARVDTWLKEIAPSDALRKKFHQEKLEWPEFEKAYRAELKKKEAEFNAIVGEKKDIAWGSQIRSYVLQPYRLVKDHRTKVEVGDVDRVLDGDLEKFIKAYLQTRAQQAVAK